MRTFARHDRETGSITWMMLIAGLVVIFLSMLIANIMTESARSRENMHTVLTTQRTDAAVSDALARLSAGQTVPATRADASPVCQQINGRGVCYQYWALPTPGQAVDPVRYTLVTNTWIDRDGNGAYPTDGRTSVRAIAFPIEAITYQSGPDVDPTSVDGQIQYVASPAGLLNNALHGFTSVTLNGPDTDVDSYNSLNGANGTRHGVVSSGGFVSYGRDTSADRTNLYGNMGVGGVQTSRCTGEVCEESDVQALTYSYAAPNEAAVKWIQDATCTTTVNDWVASENGATLPTGTLCVNGNLVIDAPTKLQAAAAAVYVRGNIDIRQSVNAPETGRVATPGRLAIYSAGQYVSFTPEVASAPGLGVSALLWAPRATCTTDPGTVVADAAGDYTGQTSYFGSLVCDNISLGGSWKHQLDDAQTVSFIDPVPGAKKAWTIGNAIGIDTSEEWDTPPGWQESLCVLPNPIGATHYWKLAEPSGLTAVDSAGSNDGTWMGSASGRSNGLCGKAAGLSAGGTVTSGQNVISATQGVTLEWWGRGTVGEPVTSAGVSVSMDATRHLSVTSGGTTAKFPFTVQGAGAWHLYTVTVSNDGTATLYVDGEPKETVTVGSPTAGGQTVLAKGTSGIISDVVVYSRTLTEGDVRDRFTTWQMNVNFTTPDAGTPFGPPTFTDTGSDHTAINIAWTAYPGTLTTPDATLELRRSATEDFADPVTVKSYPGNNQAGTDTLVNPEGGEFFYRLCVVHNGDVKCSNQVKIDTVPIAVAPAEVTFTADDTTKAFTLTWAPVTFTNRYEVQYALDGSTTWTNAAGTAGAVQNYGTAESANPTYLAGRQWTARVRTVNARGTSPWSEPVSAQAAPAVPTVTWTSPTDTTLQAVWGPSTGRADQFEYQLKFQDESTWTDAWGPSQFASGTSTGRSVTSGVHGTRWYIQIRAIAGEKTSAWVTANGLQSVGPVSIVGQHFTGRSTDENTLTNLITQCPAGTTPYSRMRDKLSTWTDWNTWKAWTTSTSNFTATATHFFATSGTASLNINNEVRCRNDETGAMGAATGRGWTITSGTSLGWQSVTDSVASASTGTVRARGWLFHKNNPAHSTTIHMYAAQGTSASRGTACSSKVHRPDVSRSYTQTGDYQGYDCTLTGVASGTRSVKIYGIDQFGTGTVLHSADYVIR